jgi:outer membrane protein assembly factor BamA
MRSMSQIVAGCMALAVALVNVKIPAHAQQSAPLVVDVSVSGNVHVPTDRILAVIKERAGQRFDPNLVKQDLQAIFDLGYFADQVPPLIRQRPNGISITYRVGENPLISSIVFTGNTHVPSDTLLALMDTAPGQVYDTATFHEDVIRINSYYDKLGYGGELPSHVANLSIDAKTSVLSIQIREGLTVDKIEVKGDSVLAASKIEGSLATKSGQVYSDQLRDKDYAAIKALYEKSELTVGDFAENLDPASIDLAKGTANLVVTVSAARIGAIAITGNTRTRDVVIRRELRERPGMLLSTGFVRADFEHLQGLQFFDKVEPSIQPGPDPKKPSEVTVVFNVKEKRSNSLSLGVGYSGGVNGAGLTGNIGFSENDLAGSGNGLGVQYQKGARLTDGSLNGTIPYLGNSKDSDRPSKYSLGASLFTQLQTNYYQVYQVSNSGTFATPPVISTPPPSGTSSGSAQLGTVPVTLEPNSLPVSGTVATYRTRVDGTSLTLGRHFSYFVNGSLGLNAQRIENDVMVPLPYFVAGNQPAALANPNLLFSNPFVSSNSGNSLGIIAPSIANTINGQGYNLRSATVGLTSNTEDNYLTPQRGTKAAVTEELSLTGLGSQFNYTITTLDLVRFFPFLKRTTLGIHGEYGTTTGAIPATKLFTLSDQQIRGYNTVYFGTNLMLGQTELRIPLTPDRKFALVMFGDYGALETRGALPLTDQFGDVLANYGDYIYHGDAGLGARFEVPGFGLLRLDYARGKSGNHASFGIGQSF